ncbi:Shugoshin N-terminal [Penicillium argentinense]|uniref:Shugoshin N-terminal n=1 Tax=Penicillium argentinense TaxID=1131581 RepID=A0A9W9G523_9EURO|nr:Shugoshin N-terminal [Penicillium argentinense]KAJ5112098.1 Shugoshin N-terminal [Penicillium argentinense]
MARLNDFAAPVESVDALKRRFVRQNREIMRVNSMQSMRIRSLESEVSHLLSENVSLRGQIITLTQENERLKAAKFLQNGVYEMKTRLDTKIAELNGLVSELGALPRKAGKLPQGKSFDSDRPRTEAPPRLNDPDYSADVDDGKLPAIMEDKYYPRRTLEPQEAHSIVESGSCLPDSPGDHHHEEQRHESEHSMSSSEEATPDLQEILPENQAGHSEQTNTETFLPPTLETRRRKKKKPELTATPGEDFVRTGHATSNDETKSANPTKLGSKRKFSLDDDAVLSDPAPEDDDFQFNRLSRSPKQSDPFEFIGHEFSPSKTPVGVKRGSSNSNTAKRKVLEPKSSNTTLGSPKKARAAPQPDIKPTLRIGGNENMPSPQKPKDLESHKAKSLSQNPRVRQVTILQKQKRTSRSIETEETTPCQLKTTAPRDSPVAKSGDNLPGVSDMSGASRPSRRRGTVVSYAEPNLRDKMRRPTKEMADAVTGRRSSSFQLARDSLDLPLNEHESAGSVLSDVVSNNGTSEQVPTQVSRRRRKVSSTNKDEGVFKSSMDQDDDSTVYTEVLGSRRQSRRHSSNPKSTVDLEDSLDSNSPSSAQMDSSFDNDEAAGWKQPPTIDAGHQRETRVVARRRSMMI